MKIRRRREKEGEERKSERRGETKHSFIKPLPYSYAYNNRGEERRGRRERKRGKGVGGVVLLHQRTLHAMVSSETPPTLL